MLQFSAMRAVRCARHAIRAWGSNQIVCLAQRTADCWHHTPRYSALLRANNHQGIQYLINSRIIHAAVVFIAAVGDEQ